jgi:hypothetical protein
MILDSSQSKHRIDRDIYNKDITGPALVYR